MKIAITGTKGIPNRYGGFEQLAEFLSVGLVKRGHEVTVYNPHFYPFRNKEYKGVQIIYKANYEKIFGPIANIFYDYLCIRDAVKKKAEVILECGYASAYPALSVISTRTSKIVVHMDGMEWKRAKWKWFARTFIKHAERRVIKLCEYLICDHSGIHDYLINKYIVNPYCIRYGARSFRSPEESRLDQYFIQPEKYYLVIARLEPENNIEEIIKGYLNSNASEVLIIIGQNNTRHGRSIIGKYGKHPKIWIKEGNYNIRTLDSLRYFAKAYFHGHSVGGSNPSLLEAMAAGAFIIAHDNNFNKSILEQDGMYFRSAGDVSNIISNIDKHLEKKESFIEANRRKIDEKFRWERIINEYEDLFRRVLSGDKS